MHLFHIEKYNTWTDFFLYFYAPIEVHETLLRRHRFRNTRGQVKEENKTIEKRHEELRPMRSDANAPMQWFNRGRRTVETSSRVSVLSLLYDRFSVYLVVSNENMDMSIVLIGILTKFPC